MTEPRNVLILTADAGFGHRSAANAIAAALEISYKDSCNVFIHNPLDDKSVPAFLRDTQTEYDTIVRNLPDLYKLNYQFTDTSVPAAVLERALTALLFASIRSVLKRYKPDVIISTHGFYMAPLNTYLTLRKLPIPFLTVITDLTNVHRLWFNQGADYCLMPTEEAYQEAIEFGLPAEMCKVTGIPVRPIFGLEKRDKATIRAELGWAPEVTTALVAGSSRIKNLMSFLHVLNHSGLQFQFVLVAGGDAKLYQDYQNTEWHTATYIYNYVEQMPEFMHASDLIIGKAGGLTVTESLASGLPLLLVDVTPGQEDGNAKYVVDHGVGERARDPLNALEILFHWLQRDNYGLKERAAKAKAVGKPFSAFEVADLAMEAAEKGRTIPSSRLLSWVPRFKELLRAYDISEPTDI